MAVTHNKFIFFHIPKTGGTFVTRYLLKEVADTTDYQIDTGDTQDLSKAHITPDTFSNGYLTDKFKFALVRHPLTWYQSLFAYRQEAGWDKNYPLYQFKSDDFNEYVSGIMKAYPDGWFSSICKRFLGDNLAKVDFVGRKETLLSDLMTALDRAGVPYNKTALYESHIVNPASTLPEYNNKIQYRADVRELVLKSESWVYQKFYDFNTNTDN